MALPIFHNVPYKQIDKAALRTHADGTGEIAFKLVRGQRIAYLTLWPSARPFHWLRPEPALRCIRDVRGVGAIVTRAMVEANGGKAGVIAEPQRDAPDLTSAVTA